MYPQNLVAFAKKVKELNPEFLITLPVSQYPSEIQVAMINAGFTKDGKSNNLIDSVDISVFSGLSSLQYVEVYGNATDEGNWSPIQVDVPYDRILTGIQGTAQSPIIREMAKDVCEEKLGGFMVWFSSVMDGTNGNKTAFSYGNDDASSTISSNGEAWKSAIETMTNCSNINSN